MLLEPDSLDRWGERMGVAGRPGGPDELELARGLRCALHSIFSASRARPSRTSSRCPGSGSPTRRPSPPARWSARRTAASALDWSREETRRVRFAVAADAVALLADPARMARLHRCPGRDCGWVFLDTSGRRRWCSMQTCGSRREDAPDVRPQARRGGQSTRRSSGAGDRLTGPSAVTRMSSSSRMPPTLGVVDPGLDGEDHALAQRDLGRRDQERRLVDLGADRVARAVQAGADLGVRFHDDSLRRVDVAGRVPEPRRRDRVVVGLLDDVPRLRRPSRSASRRARSASCRPSSRRTARRCRRRSRRPPAACARRASRAGRRRGRRRGCAAPGALPPRRAS